MAEREAEPVRDLSVMASLRPLAAAVRLTRTLPLALLGRAAPHPFVVVYYHLVSDESRPHVQHYAYLGSDAFRADLRFLKERYGFFPLADVSRPDLGENLRGAVITFDDGFVECSTVAAPILEELGAPAIFFVTTDAIDNRVPLYELPAALCANAVLAMSASRARELSESLKLRLGEDDFADIEARGRTRAQRRPHRLNAESEKLRAVVLGCDWNQRETVAWLCAQLSIDPVAYVRDTKPYLASGQIRDLASRGFAIGAHGTTHRDLGQAEPEEVELEITASCRTISNLVGRAPAPFAFPYGGWEEDRARLTRIQAAGGAGAYFGTAGLPTVDSEVVPRLWGESPLRGRGRDGLGAVIRAHLAREIWGRR